MRLKHRILVEVTFDKRVTAKTAAAAVRIGLSRDEMLGYGYNVISTNVKEAERVIQAEHRHRNRIREQTRSSDDKRGDGQPRS